MRCDFAVAMVFLMGMNLMAQSTVPADRRNFVACPILRDTKTAPCWLAEYKGETYYLGGTGGVTDDFHPPQLDHEMLVGRYGCCGATSMWRHFPARRPVSCPPPSPRSAPGWPARAAAEPVRCTGTSPRCPAPALRPGNT